MPQGDPEHGATTTTQTSLVRPQVGYQEEAFVTRDGLGVSTETTIFYDTPLLPNEAAVLDRAVLLAAETYTLRVKRMTLGLLGPGPREDQRYSIFLRPFGIKLFEVMGFSGICSSGTGEYYQCVERGFLAANHYTDDELGRLYYSWTRGADGHEVFQTQVRDYVPRLAGRRRTRLGLLFYRWTQVNLHRLVMWRYHVWVQRERAELIAAAAIALEASAAGDEKEAKPKELQADA